MLLCFLAVRFAAVAGLTGFVAAGFLAVVLLVFALDLAVARVALVVVRVRGLAFGAAGLIVRFALGAVDVFFGARVVLVVRDFVAAVRL